MFFFCHHKTNVLLFMKSLITLFFVFLIFSLFSCLNDASIVGGKWVESSFRNVLVDTCTVSLSTILSDSLVTSGDTICQIGHRKDELWGEITASFYAEYEVPSATFNENIDYKFDSITIRLYSSGNYLGDTLTTQRIYMYPLTENIELDDNNYLYNTSKAVYDSQSPLASFYVTPTPGRRSKELEVRLPDAWGEEWFNLLVEDDRVMESQTFFQNYFKGIAFIPDANDACVNGFQVNDSSLCITLYYHSTTEIATEQTVVFNTSSTLTFNKVEYDRSGTPIADLQSGDDNALTSLQTNHQSYLQGMTGMYISIDFPYLNNLCVEGELVTIESATLRLYPVKGTYDGMYPLPKTLTLYTADKDNVTQGIITDLTGSSVQTGNLVVDEMAYEETYYSFDLTSFLQTNLGTTGYNWQKLQLYLPDNLFFTTLQGVIFGDGDHTANKENTKLTILYKTYQQ